MDNSRERLLILSDPSDDNKRLIESLSEFYEVSFCSDYKDVITQLKNSDYHRILVNVGDFLPLERAMIDQRAGLILNTIGEGV